MEKDRLIKFAIGQEVKVKLIDFKGRIWIDDWVRLKNHLPCLKSRVTDEEVAKGHKRRN